MNEPSVRWSKTGLIRVAMLVVIAVICLASALWVSDPDLWIPFVCIIAVMGVSTRGGALDALPFVLIEAAVVVVLGIATFSGSRDFIWAASVAVSLVAVGKIAFLEIQKRDEAAKSANEPEAKPEERAEVLRSGETAKDEGEASRVRRASGDDD